MSSFENRLGARLASELDAAIRPFDPQAIAHAAMHGRRAFAPPPRLPMLVGAAVLLMAAAVAVGSALLRSEIVEPPSAPFRLAGVLEPTGSLHEVSQVPAAVALPDGRVLVVIPSNQSGKSPDAEVWNPATGQWTIVGPMARDREEPRMVLLRDGRVLVVGSIGAERSAEIFDPVTASFSLVPSQPSTIGASAILLRDGRVLLAGGASTVDENGPRGISDRAELFDPATSSFVPVGSMLHPRAEHELHMLADGRVLVLGGAIIPGERTAWSIAEIFDPATRTFADAGRTSLELQTFSWSTTLPDGRLAFLRQPGWGQFPDRSRDMSLMFYDPETGAQTAGPVIPPSAPVYDVRVIEALSSNEVLLYGFDKASRSTGPGGILDRGWLGTVDLSSGRLAETAIRDASWGTTVRLIDGRIMVVGGVAQHQCGEFFNGTGACMDATTAVDILR